MATLQTRVSAVTTYMNPIVGTALDVYKKGEWMTLVRAQERVAIEKAAKKAKEGMTTLFRPKILTPRS